MGDIIDDTCLICRTDIKLCDRRPPGRFKKVIDDREMKFGYRRALDVSKNTENEDFIYLLCTFHGTGKEEPDYLATIDANPKSKRYSTIVHRLPMPYVCDEVSSMSWNVPSSYLKDKTLQRDKLIISCLNSNRIYVVFIPPLPEKPSLIKVIHYSQLFKTVNISALSTVRCIPPSDILISGMSDKNNRPQGGFAWLNANRDYDLKGPWEICTDDDLNPFDYAYNPLTKTLIATDLCNPNAFYNGFDDTLKHQCSNAITLWDMNDRTRFDKVVLTERTRGVMPMVIRFTHKPTEAEAYIGCANGVILKYFTNSKQEKARDWKFNEVFKMDVKQLSNWKFIEMFAMITDMCISLDDKYLYVCSYFHGHIRQLSLKKKNPKSKRLFVSSIIQLGGMLCNDMNLSFVGSEGNYLPERLKIKGKPVYGGPAKMKLSMDGKRLYVTFSFCTRWDAQTYPEMMTEGSVMLMLDVNVLKGGMTINNDFYIDFGKEPYGTCLPREMKFASADASSDTFEHN